MVATSQTELQKLVTKVEEESRKMTLGLNEDKTECMVVTKEKGLHKCEIVVSNKAIKQTQSFKYLEVILTTDKNIDLKSGQESLRP